MIIKSAPKLLSDLKVKDISELKADPHLAGIAKYNFMVSIEVALDICNHLISKNGFCVPDDYSDSFRILLRSLFSTRIPIIAVEI